MVQYKETLIVTLLLKREVNSVVVFYTYSVVLKILLFAECNTGNVVDLFAKSISTSDIKATPCEDYKTFKSGNCGNNEDVIFGENINRNAKGFYFVHL